MSNSQIPNLPAVTALSGPELLECVQAGVSDKVTVAQIAAYTVTTYPYPFPENPVTVPHGGTGLTSITADGILYGNGTSAVGVTAAGTTGQVLVGNTGAAPTWAAVSSSLVSSISFGTTGLTPATATTGSVVVAGTLVVANGGTGVSSITAHGVLLGNGASAISVTAVGLTGQVLSGNTGADPTWINTSTNFVTSLSFGTTGLTPNSPTTGAIVVSGTLVPANGGTGISSYTTGDILYASGATALSALAGVATGNVLLSGGISTAPAWGKVSLTAAVSGVLPVANGGSGAGTFTANGVLLGNTTSAFAVTAAGTTGQVFVGNTGSAPTWSNVSSVAVTTISFGTTGLTPNSATAGAVTVAGTLVVSNGGTGAATLTGVLKGNGTSAFTAATAGSDYVAPGTATTFTAKQTFSGSTSVIAAVLTNCAEVVTVSATAATGTINYDITTQSVLYYTTSASANWTVNFRASSGTSLDAAMSTGQAITVAFLVTNGATPYYNSAVQVDGNAVTPKYQGGTAWAAGNASSVDAYTYTIVKTGSAAFTIFAAQTQFK